MVPNGVRADFGGGGIMAGVKRADKFDCCAAANGWKDADKLKVLPTLLRGPAATYYHSLDGDQRDMTSFVQRFRAIHHPDVASSQHVHAIQSASHAASPSHDDSLAASITQLTATVAVLAADQKELRVAFTPPHGPAPPQRQSRPPPSSGNFRNSNNGFRGCGRWPTPGRQERNASQRSQRCFNCHMLGNFAKDCPWDSQCQLCYGWGHTTQACANNSPQNEHDQ
eukprot:gene18437-biopygen12377